MLTAFRDEFDKIHVRL